MDHFLLVYYDSRPESVRSLPVPHIVGERAGARTSLTQWGGGGGGVIYRRGERLVLACSQQYQAGLLSLERLCYTLFGVLI